MAGHRVVAYAQDEELNSYGNRLMLYWLRRLQKKYLLKNKLSTTRKWKTQDAKAMDSFAK